MKKNDRHVLSYFRKKEIKAFVLIIESSVLYRCATAKSICKVQRRNVGSEVAGFSLDLIICTHLDNFVLTVSF